MGTSPVCTGRSLLRSGDQLRGAVLVTREGTSERVPPLTGVTCGYSCVVLVVLGTLLSTALPPSWPDWALGVCLSAPQASLSLLAPSGLPVCHASPSPQPAAVLVGCPSVRAPLRGCELPPPSCRAAPHLSLSQGAFPRCCVLCTSPQMPGLLGAGTQQPLPYRSLYPEHKPGPGPDLPEPRGGWSGLLVAAGSQRALGC